MNPNYRNKVLIIQENGHHPRNRDFRECFALKRAIESWKVHADVWGKGHASFNTAFEKIVNKYDAVISLENYDSGWHPDLSAVKIPKVFWCIDAHMGVGRYIAFVKKNRFDIVFNSTMKFVETFNGIAGESLWLPNAYDSFLIDRLFDVGKTIPLGFCGNVVNRGEWIDYLKKRYGLHHDQMVIGPDMVRAVNSYHLHWNMNVSIDINYRNFETLGCCTLLLTNYVPYLECLFKEDEHIIVYRNKRELEEKLAHYLSDEKERKAIAHSGYLHVRKHHRYVNRAKNILEKLGLFSNDRVVESHSTIDLATQRLIDHKAFLFVSGATKSGTTLMANVLDCSDQISILKSEKGKVEEGQWHQNVYPWGRGNSDLKETYHYTETHPLVNDTNRLRLFRCWSRLWDLSRPVLAEKSPHNIIKTRFLQAMFPNSKFIILVRNGIVQATGEALQENGDPIACCREWVAAYRFLMNDIKYLKSCLIVRYEDLVHHTEATIRNIWKFIGVPCIDICGRTFFVHRFKNGVKRPDFNKIKDMNGIHFENFLNRFTREKQDEMLRICQPMMAEFGYHLSHETISQYMATEDPGVLLCDSWPPIENLNSGAR